MSESEKLPTHPRLREAYIRRKKLEAAVLSEAAQNELEHTEEILRRPIADWLSAARIWFWGEGTPLPPRPLDEHVRFSFHYLKEGWLQRDNELFSPEKKGFVKLGIFSKIKNGKEIVDDVAGACIGVYTRLKDQDGLEFVEIDDIDRLHPFVQTGGWFYTSVDVHWRRR